MQPVLDESSVIDDLKNSETAQVSDLSEQQSVHQHLKGPMRVT